MNIRIPKIRIISPATLANDIIGVQPMSSSAASIFKVNPAHDVVSNKKISETFIEVTDAKDVVVPDNHVLVDVGVTIAKWMKDQPSAMWRSLGSSPDIYVMDRMIVTQEFYTFMCLQWT